MSTKLTRREIAVALSSTALLTGQTQNTPSAPSPDEELKIARDANRQSAQQLAQFPLPIATEPATHFKA
jgi:hypothetical protein